MDFCVVSCGVSSNVSVTRGVHPRAPAPVVRLEETCGLLPNTAEFRT